MSIHLIVTEAEQFAIVNALAFYDGFHTSEIDDDWWEQWRIAFREDNCGTAPKGLVDRLTTKIATSN